MQVETKKKSKPERTLIIIAILSIILIVGLWFLTYFNLKEVGLTERGTFGDMFGGINALFSGLAFVGIIITILLQRNELALQREELKHTREELKRSAEAQEKSEKALVRQAENLKISAKLTALDTLVNYYSSEENREQDEQRKSFGIQSLAKSKKRDYIERIERILEAKEDS